MALKVRTGGSESPGIITKISIVAEGHIDLMRKFRKIQVCKEEWEMMKMRVLALERGVREIKAKMDVA